MAPHKNEAPLDVAKLKRQRLSARRLFEKSSKAVEAALAQQIRQLTNELAKERAQRASLADQLNAANDKLQNGSHTIEGMRVELDAQRKKSSEAQAKLSEANAKLRVATDECESLRDELLMQRHDCANLTVERDAERKKNGDLEKQLQVHRDQALPHAVLKGCSCLFAPAHDFDFRKVSGNAKPLIRGGVPYIRPAGSMRYALEVANRYDDKDWLRDDAGGWAVAYHGTTLENAVSIVRNGFHLSKGKRFSYGTGVYCSPNPKTAKSHYSAEYIENGKTRRVVLQVRVKPLKYQVVRQAVGAKGEYWLVADPADIRPYGLCVYGL